MFSVYCIISENEMRVIDFDTYSEAYNHFAFVCDMCRTYNDDTLIVVANEDGDWVHTSDKNGDWD